MPLTAPPTHPLDLAAESYVRTGALSAQEAAPVINAVAKVFERLAVLRNDGTLAPVTVAQAMKQPLAVIEDFESGTARLRDEELPAAIDRATALGKVNTSRAPEIRAWLATKTRDEQLREYFNAIDAQDAETVHAIEDAPRSMSFLDDEARERGAARKLEKASPASRAQIDALKQRIAGRQHVASIASRLLNGAR